MAVIKSSRTTLVLVYIACPTTRGERDEGGRREKANEDTRRQALQVSEGLAQGGDFDLEDVEIALGRPGRSRAPRSSYVSQSGPLSA